MRNQGLTAMQDPRQCHAETDHVQPRRGEHRCHRRQRPGRRERAKVLARPIVKRFDSATDAERIDTAVLAGIVLLHDDRRHTHQFFVALDHGVYRLWNVGGRFSNTASSASRWSSVSWAMV